MISPNSLCCFRWSELHLRDALASKLGRWGVLEEWSLRVVNSSNFACKCVQIWCKFVCTFIEFVGFNDATCSYYVTGGSFFVSHLFVGVISFQHVSWVRCTFFFQNSSQNTPGLCWYDGALETVGGQLWRFRGQNWWYVWCFYVFFLGNFFYRSFSWGFQFWPSDFRLSLIDEHAGGWAQAFHTDTTSVTSVVFLSKQS